MPTAPQSASGLTPTSTSTARRPGLPRLLALTVILAGTAALAAPHVARAASAVTTTDLNLRSGPGTSYQVLTVMPAGSSVSTTGDPQNGFYPVSYGGTDGWAAGTYLDLGGGSGTGSDSGSGGGTAVATTALNLRGGPSLGDGVLLVIPDGATVTLTGGSQNGFLAVSYNGTNGWASASYLDTSGGGSSGSGGGGDNSGGGGQTAVVTSALNLRSGPSTDSSVLTVMPAGSTVQTTGGLQSGFYPVTYGGQAGFASGAYLDFSGGSSASRSDSGSGSGDITSIIYAAADRYGQSREDMLRVATCESGLDPNQVTPPYSASGLFQFLPSTWASTPYANDDIFDPWANANAAGWMWSVGRRNEWVCQ